MKVGYIEDVVVSRRDQGLGIGSKLVTHATDHAYLIEGCKKILLYCSKKNSTFL